MTDLTDDDLRRAREWIGVRAPHRCGPAGESILHGIAELLAEVDALKPPKGYGGETHWEGCWKARGHHECAEAEVERLRAELEATKDRATEVEMELRAALDAARAAEGE